MTITTPPIQSSDSESMHEIVLNIDQGGITQVDLYGDRAEVTRIFHVDLSSGQTNVIVGGLSGHLIEDSLRSVNFPCSSLVS